MMKADSLMLRGQAIVSEASAIDAERNQADALLVARIRAGDEQAFELLMARYQAPLFRYLRGLVHDQEQARDLLQETAVILVADDNLNLRNARAGKALGVDVDADDLRLAPEVMPPHFQ